MTAVIPMSVQDVPRFYLKEVIYDKYDDDYNSPFGCH